MKRSNSIVLLVFLSFCGSKPQSAPVLTFSQMPLTEVFDQLLGKTNPFDFYKDVFSNYRFELKSTLIDSTLPADVAAPESVTIFENTEEDESRFYKKSLPPISEVELKEKAFRDYIRYDKSKEFIRTSYNPEFDLWKKGIFRDITLTFDLAKLQNQKQTVENQWLCYEAEKQKLCVDHKTGLPVFGKAIKKISAETAVSMVFSLVYGEDMLPPKPPLEKEPVKPVEKKKPSTKSKVKKKEALRKKP